MRQNPTKESKNTFLFYFHGFFNSFHKQCQMELRKLLAWVWLSVTKTSLSVSDGPYMHYIKHFST